MDSFESLQNSLEAITRSKTYVGFTTITQQAKEIDETSNQLKKADVYMRSFAFGELDLSIRGLAEACLSTRKNRGWQRWEEIKQPLIQLMSDAIAYFAELAEKYPEVDTQKYIRTQKEDFRTVVFSNRDFDILR